MHSRGFTLIEMLVVMAISAILIAAAVPAFQWTVTRNRISDATNTLLGHMEYARMESSRRGVAISICRTLDPNAAPACSSAASATVDGNDWASGWLVFENVDVVGSDPVAWDPATDRIIFRQQIANNENVRVMVHSDIGVDTIAFLPRGTGQVSGAGTFAVTYGTAPAPAATRALGSLPLTGAGRCIFVTLLGSMRVTRPGVAPCPAA